MQRPHHLLATLAAACLLAACGGGSSTGSPASTAPTTPQSVSITGSVATGLPLAGTVTVKDSLGASKTVTIGANGSYTVDVTGMTAPFVFRASGTVNGETYVLHSAAVAADANGTINITPFTDLVVANIAGKIAANYFDAPNFASLTPEAVSAETAKLKEKLLPLLTSLGVDSSIDLLRTPFTPLSSALDKALDLISVSVDPATNLATITDIATQATITDDVTIPATGETAAPTLPALTTAEATTATDDLAAIRKVFADLSALYATGLPTPSALAPLFTTAFVHGDTQRMPFLNAIATYGDLVGGGFADVNVKRIDYSDPTKITAHVSFVTKNKDGQGLELIKDWKLRKGSDGVWRMHGNQRVLDLEGHAHMVNSSNGQGGSCVTTGLEFVIRDPDTTNDPGAIAYIVVKGPGLPAAGVKYVNPNTGDAFNIAGGIDSYYRMATTCGGTNTLGDAAIAAIPDRSRYELQAFDANGAALALGTDGKYVEGIPQRPMTLAEVGAAGVFPVIADTTLAAFAAYAGGDFAYSASNLIPARYVFTQLNYISANGVIQSTEADVVTATGLVTGTLTLPAPTAGDSLLHAEFKVESHDGGWRHLNTLISK